MPQYKDDKTNTWFCKFYYTDYTGTRQQKKKRGFPTKREAAAWERSFLEKQQADMNMPFSSFVELYFEDMGHRLRQSTIETKRYMVDKKLLPFFGKIPVSQIKATDIRKWQNELIAYRDEDDKPYSETYLKSINNQLTALLNYAVRYYGLRENPCHKAGSMGKSHAEEMQFWTKQEFDIFIPAVSDKPQSQAAFMTLYYTGMRIGELMALTPADIDLQNGIISVSKSYQRLGQEDVITPPKTPKSNRIIAIPDFLCEELKSYLGKLYELGQDERMFHFTKHFLTHEMVRGCKKSGVKKIRLHDIRHSHASLLIELGFSPLLIADRLGHEKVETTLNTYSHLYPHKQEEVVQKLQSLNLVPK